MSADRVQMNALNSDVIPRHGEVTRGKTKVIDPAAHAITRAWAAAHGGTRIPRLTDYYEPLLKAVERATDTLPAGSSTYPDSPRRVSTWCTSAGVGRARGRRRPRFPRPDRCRCACSSACTAAIGQLAGALPPTGSSASEFVLYNNSTAGVQNTTGLPTKGQYVVGQCDGTGSQAVCTVSNTGQIRASSSHLDW